MGATILASLPADLLAQADRPQAPTNWDPGRVRHLLPTVSDTRILIKASFPRIALDAAHLARRRDIRARADERHRRRVLAVRRWRSAARPAILALDFGAGGAATVRALGPLDVSRPERPPERFRVLFFACAGGHEGLGYLPYGDSPPLAAPRPVAINRKRSSPTAITCTGTCGPLPPPAE